MELARKYKTLLNKYGANTPLRLAHFFAQLDAESGLKPISENLNYSASALRSIFGKYFPNDEIAKNYARIPERIANLVYANRMGNGSQSSGDGWRYRGRGFVQITGKDNYTALSKATGLDYVKNPDLLLNEADAMISALWYWNEIKGNSLADKDDLDGISDMINIGRKTSKYGDANGFKHRSELLDKYKKIFK